jgi:predicted DCC family thiol-disulfide oxidoreductase YuxK
LPMEDAPRPGPRERECALVLYDRDCGFCRWTLARLLALDRSHRLRPVALQSPEARRLLPGMDDERRLASAHLVMADGRVYSGGDAVAPLLRLLPAGGPLAAAAGLVPAFWRVAYDWVAARRGVFGPRIPDEAVARATARIDAHV